jgi:hypothetical protein
MSSRLGSCQTPRFNRKYRRRAELITDPAGARLLLEAHSESLEFLAESDASDRNG